MKNANDMVLQPLFKKVPQISFESVCGANRTSGIRTAKKPRTWRIKTVTSKAGKSLLNIVLTLNASSITAQYKSVSCHLWPSYDGLHKTIRPWIKLEAKYDAVAVEETQPATVTHP
jgi:hypothetical protein